MADNGENLTSVKPEETDESSPLLQLRRRWELASVLNFLSVFEPLMGKELNLSAEEIEDALINPNASLAKLHVALLKGIRPFNKNMSQPDIWVTKLSKKLTEWWPWVAEGENPLTAAKGEEMSRYKELDPITRLLILKALCEIRILEDDLVSYINNELKQGVQLSHFRKDKIGEDRNGVSYWYNGNPVIGHRLYREVNNGLLKQKRRGKNCLNLLQTNSEWEVLATNLDEFRKVSVKFSSCQVGVEAAVHEIIETEVIPVLEKLQKKKEKDLKQRQREESYVSGYHSYAGITRSCRTRKPAKYTFDDFDRTIDEAIELTRKRKGREVERNATKRCKHGEVVVASDRDLQNDAHVEEEPSISPSEDKPIDKQVGGDSNENDHPSKGGDNNEEDDQRGESSENDGEDDLQSEEGDKGKDTNYIYTENVGKSVNAIASDCEIDSSDFEHVNITTGLQKQNSSNRIGHNLRKARNPEAKNRYRHRPTRNCALESFVVPDSEDESSTGNLTSNSSSEEDPSDVPDSEDEISS